MAKSAALNANALARITSERYQDMIDDMIASIYLFVI